MPKDEQTIVLIHASYLIAIHHPSLRIVLRIGCKNPPQADPINDLHHHVALSTPLFSSCEA
jgi:hypothetical protein